MKSQSPKLQKASALFVLAGVLLYACGGANDSGSAATAPAPAPNDPAVPSPAPPASAATPAQPPAAPPATPAEPPSTPPTAWSNGVAPSSTVIYEGPPIQVSPQLVGIHWTQFTSSYGGPQHGPRLDQHFKVNAFRVFGTYNLYWNKTEVSPGVFDFSEWAKARKFWSDNGVKFVTLNLHGVPGFYQTRGETEVGQWSMQLPKSKEAVWGWLTAVTNYAPEIKQIEVANEVWTADNNAGSNPSRDYWGDTNANLRTLMDWVLDWRKTHRPDIRIQAPSVPGYSAHINGLFTDLLDTYARTCEFDSFSAHGYGSASETLHKTTNTALPTMQQKVSAKCGPGKKIRDGEHGFWGNSTVDAATVYNTVVRGALMGLDGIDFFEVGSVGNDESNLGLTAGGWPNASVLSGFEDGAVLAGKWITKVTTGQGGRWSVEGYTGGAPATAAPPATPAPPAGPPATALSWTACAREYGSCTFEGRREVRYAGVPDGSRVITKVAESPLVCNDKSFGAAPTNFESVCHYSSQTTTAPVTTAPQ
ncbi:MAG: hypothetical protein HZC37_29965 [Burkholderiales bacterium]|nr:hypothetical protein [Burkholderiales bacterium]